MNKSENLGDQIASSVGEWVATRARQSGMIDPPKLPPAEDFLREQIRVLEDPAVTQITIRMPRQIILSADR